MHVRGLHPPQEVHHGRALDLETADRPGGPQGRVGRRVARRERPELELLLRLRDGRQAPHREQVELDQPEVLDGVLVEVGHAQALGRGLERQAALDRARGQDDAADVEGDLAEDVLELGGELPGVEAAGGRGGLPQPGRLGEVRHALGLAAGLVGRHAEGPERLVEGRAAAEVLQLADVGRAGLARAVALEDVAQDLVAAPGVEVDVDVRRVGPAAVEEALEVEVELDRVDVGQAEEPAQEGRGPRAAQVVEDAAAAGELDDVVDDEEVGAEARLLDGGELAAGPLALLPGQVLRGGQPLLDDLAEAPREEIGREVGDDAVEGELALFGDLGRPGQGLLRRVAEAAQGQGLLVRAEDPDFREQPVALGRVRDLFLDGAEEDEALGAGQVLDGVGPDDGQVEFLGTRSNFRMVHVPEIRRKFANSAPKYKSPRRDLLAQLGQTRALAHPGGHVPFSVPVFGLGGRRSPVRHVDHDESRRVADLAPVEDLHEVRVALSRPDQEDEAPAADFELAAEERPVPAGRRDALPLAPAVDVADVREPRRRKPSGRRPARRLLERDAPPAPAVHGMDAERDEHAVHLVRDAVLRT